MEAKRGRPDHLLLQSCVTGSQQVARFYSLPADFSSGILHHCSTFDRLDYATNPVHAHPPLLSGSPLADRLISVPGHHESCSNPQTCT